MNNLYLVSTPEHGGYDTYDSMVVSAPSEDEARKIHPAHFVTHVSNDKWVGTYAGGPRTGEAYTYGSYDWVPYSEIHKLDVEKIGTTDKPTGVILASFNAG